MTPSPQADHSAFAALAVTHAPKLRRLGMRLTGDPHESEELVQESLVRAWASWSRFDPCGSFGAYLSRIVVNVFISRHRHRQVIHRVHTTHDVAGHLYDPHRIDFGSPADSCANAHTAKLVRDSLLEVPAHYRRVVELVDLEGCSYKDAALRLDIPIGTVMSRLHRARHMLRDKLEPVAAELELRNPPTALPA